MYINEKHVAGKMTAVFTTVNFLSFLLYYFTFYVIKTQVSLHYLFYFFNELVRTLLPIIAVLASFITFTMRGFRRASLHALLFTLSWIINLFPYYAFEYAYQGIEISAVLTFALIHTLFMILVIYIEIIVLLLLMIFVTEKIGKISFANYDRRSSLFERDIFDFSKPLCAGILSVSAAVFIYNLICEIIDTVSFIKDVYGIYDAKEIIYMVFKYIFIMIMFVLSYFTAHFVKSRLIRDRTKKN